GDVVASAVLNSSFPLKRAWKRSALPRSVRGKNASRMLRASSSSSGASGGTSPAPPSPAAASASDDPPVWEDAFVSLRCDGGGGAAAGAEPASPGGASWCAGGSMSPGNRASGEEEMRTAALFPAPGAPGRGWL